jgi:hypothetical protein
MTSSEVRKMCEEIDYYGGYKLKPDDEYEFKKIMNRLKDDEDLDSLALKKLQELYGKYVKK